MLETLVQQFGGPNSLYWLAFAYFSQVIGERLFYAFTRREGYDNRDALCSISLSLMNSAIGIVVAIVLPLALYLWVYDTFRITTIEHIGLAVIAAFLVHEFSYYWEHRLGHRIGILWTFHAVHHSSNEFNHSTSSRGFYLDGKLQVVGALIAAFLGVPPVVYIAIIVVKSAYGIWNHASYVGNLGWLEHILATPRNHKVHHAVEPQYIDKNFSQVFILWDKLFGTFEPYDTPPTVGLVTPVYDNNPLTAQFAGFKQLAAKINSAPRWQDKLAYLWRPPEWVHDTIDVTV